MMQIQEIGQSVRLRRSDMGLTQALVASLSGLSRATVNQLENATIQDLSLNRVVKLLGVLGLQVHVDMLGTCNRSVEKSRRSKLAVAAQSASVSYREPMTASQLAKVLTGTTVPVSLQPHLHTLLDEAPITLLAAVVSELQQKFSVSPEQVWARMREIARSLQSSRPIWI